MDPVSQTKCAYIYDTVITSPLGSEVVKFFIGNSEFFNQNKDSEGNNINENDKNFILQIRDKLDENVYPNPENFLEDVKTTFLLKVRDFGSDSDISLSLLTLIQLVTEKFVKCFPPKNQKPSIEDLNLFFEGFDEFGKNIPNDRKSFIKFYNSSIKDNAISKRPVKPSKFQIVDQKTDVDELYKKVMELKTDKDYEKVVDIIVSHEPAYSHSDNIVEIDLYKCQPYTLKLIKNYVESQENDQENGNEKSDE